MAWGVGIAAVSVGAGVGDKVSGESGMLKVWIGVGWEQAENKTKPAIIKHNGICFFKEMFFFINSLVVA